VGFIPSRVGRWKTILGGESVMTDKLHFRVRYPNGYELEFSGSRIEVGKYFEEIMQKEKAKVNT